jgi:peptidoglycan hydrolase-like protein with peptidoglycan-binding domain
MIFRILAIAFWAVLGSASLAAAQEQAWLQIEAQPTLTAAEDRARAYAAEMPNVAGFQISQGWYAVVLGPFSAAEAAGQLSNLKRQGVIPRDSFITDGTKLRQQFWPVGQMLDPAASAAAEAVVPEAAMEPEAAIEPEVVLDATQPEVLEAPVETLQESRAAEAAMSRDERMELQEALAWYGHYSAAIDGAFGAGTRKSMAAWQEATGFEPTGVLSSEQRGILVANHKADLAEFGFEPVTEAEAGIEITLPLALVQFDHYEPPFVHFSEKNGSGLRIILISEPGDKASLYGLYDILQTLEVVPPSGERSRNDRSFTINAASDKVQSYAYAETNKGTVKGYLVVWKPQDAARMERILPALKASFRAAGDKALDPGLVPMDEAARAGLLSGLEVKTPKFSRSGFYVDAKGDVVTTAEAVAQCGRVTIDSDTEAEVLAQDAATGLAVLRPKQALAPVAFARFQQEAGRVGAEISVAGYSYEGKLPAPVLTFGTLAENAGLAGEAGISRLSVPLLAGDAGGPVLDGTGSVLGMVMSGAKAAKVLPEGVAFAVQSAVIAQALTAAGIAPQVASVSELATPDALSGAGMAMTVLVSCWE